MKKYKNVPGINRIDWDKILLINHYCMHLKMNYPKLSDNSLTIISDLMYRFDEDVTEDDSGEFYCYNPNS